MSKIDFPFRLLEKKRRKKFTAKRGQIMQPTTAKREQMSRREYCEHICSHLFQWNRKLALDKITYQLRQF